MCYLCKSWFKEIEQYNEKKRIQMIVQVVDRSFCTNSIINKIKIQ
jgi:hypothetical protein